MTKFIEKRVQLYDIAERISKGEPREKLVKELVAGGMDRTKATRYYYEALKEITPEDTILDAYKKGMMQVNLNRLETIIETSISGNSQDKQVALKAIAELNKMLGLSNDTNKVTVANNKEGEQIIQIEFSK